MHYDDSTRRRNLLSGLVLGAALGAGLALLLLPEERLRSGGRIVVRAARGLGRTIDDGGSADSRGFGGEDADDGGREDEDEDDADEVGARRRETGATSPARQRAARLARRKFEL